MATLPQPMFPIGYLEKIPAAEAPQTIRNLRSQGKIPAEVFCMDGNRLMILTDRFIDWKISRIKFFFSHEQVGWRNIL